MASVILAPIRLIRTGALYINRKWIVCQAFFIKKYIFLRLRRNKYKKHKSDGFEMSQYINITTQKTNYIDIIIKLLSIKWKLLTSKNQNDKISM